MIDAAKALSKSQNADIAFQVAMAEHLPFPAEQFDVVTAMTILCFVDTRPLSSERSRECFDPEAVSSSASLASGVRGRPSVAFARGWARDCGAGAGSGRRMSFEPSPKRPV